MNKILIVLLCGIVLSAASYAGWEHSVTSDQSLGRTYWTDSATAASCFIRNNDTGNISPAPAPSIYENTVKLNATVYSYGFWGYDGTNYYPLSDVGVADYDNRKNPGVRVDVEWLVNSNGDLYVKF